MEVTPFYWIHEQPAHWDARKAAIIGAAPAGVFDFSKGEARARGLRCIYNSVPKAHPDPRALAEWLKKRGFKEEGTTGLLRAPA